jgi:hypothetical protein
MTPATNSQPLIVPGKQRAYVANPDDTDTTPTGCGTIALAWGCTAVNCAAASVALTAKMPVTVAAATVATPLAATMAGTVWWTCCHHRTDVTSSYGEQI